MDSPELKKEIDRARQTVFRLLKIRNRSEKEIEDRLKRKKIAPETIERTLKFFRDARFIDDRQFAKWWLNARLNKPFGLKRILFELKTKGISDEIIKEELAELPPQYSEIQTVEALAKRRMARYKNVDPIKMKQRLFAYLAGRGFSGEAISKVIRKL